MFMLMGPHTALGNIPRSAEYNVEWVTGIIRYMRERDLTRANAQADGVEAWTGYVRRKAEGLLTNEVDSWMTGVNRNVDGKTTRVLARYIGSAQKYREWCDLVADNGYQHIALA
jgi:hypothetical protein